MILVLRKSLVTKEFLPWKKQNEKNTKADDVEVCVYSVGERCCAFVCCVCANVSTKTSFGFSCGPIRDPVQYMYNSTRTCTV